jgi:hypothetical protein
VKRIVVKVSRKRSQVLSVIKVIPQCTYNIFVHTLIERRRFSTSIRFLTIHIITRCIHLDATRLRNGLDACKELLSMIPGLNLRKEIVEMK